MSSTRLPGKVMATILGKPMLACIIERIRRARGPDTLCVATSIDASDDPVADCCVGLGVECYRGSLNDVLDRYYRAAQPRGVEHVVRVTADCPLLDPVLLDAIIEQHLHEGNDITSNAFVRTFPDGLDVEVIRFTALELAWREALTRHQREHVTPYFYRPDTTFRLGAYRDTVDRSALRWVVDYPRDLEFVRAVYAALYPRKPDFGWIDILGLLETQPELAEINSRPT